MKSKMRRVIIIVGSVVLAVSVHLILQSCKTPDDLENERGLCDNGVDDDGDGDTDCDDIDCLASDPICDVTSDGDADSDTDSDNGGDADADSDADSDVDGDADSDVDGDADSDEETICDPDASICDWSCESDAECVLVFDTLECCGGFPHRLHEEDEMVSCVSATHIDRLTVDRCAIDWYPGDPVPEVPAGCEPNCEGASCPECRDAGPRTRAACREGACVALCEDCCTRDDDCDIGHFCVDPDNDGQFRCLPGEHECNSDDDCMLIDTYVECAACLCGDVTFDGFRDCACYGCAGGGPPPGICANDRHCRVHEWCIDRRCEFMGEDACRETMDDCGPCAFCQRSEDQPARLMRGRCVLLDFGDTGPPPDSGCLTE